MFDEENQEIQITVSKDKLAAKIEDLKNRGYSLGPSKEVKVNNNETQIQFTAIKKSVIDRPGRQFVD
jgi:hypothetical protein